MLLGRYDDVLRTAKPLIDGGKASPRALLLAACAQAAEALTRRESFGLSGMRERVALLDGEFQIQSSMQGPKTGTKISIELPITKSEPASRTEAGRRLLHPGRRPPAQFGAR